MEYNGYKIEECRGRVVVENMRDFDPVHTFECGQCFRWHRQPDGSFTGVAGGRVANVRFEDGRLEMEGASLRDFLDFWYDYFDMGRDYSAVKEKLSEDPILREAVKFGHGIRLLRQDPWETLISFIASTNKKIPMIRKIIEALSEAFGERLEFGGRRYYAFPGVECLARASVAQVEVCRGGYRCKYIVGTAQMVKEGAMDLDRLHSMETGEARAELVRLPGVGEKVADCTLLFGGIKTDVFPVDVWVKRVMQELYFKREAAPAEIREFARRAFGRLAGFAQQYLFYYARENRIGTG